MAALTANQANLLQMLFGALTSQVIYVAARSAKLTALACSLQR
jgi:hypothetical protein